MLSEGVVRGSADRFYDGAIVKQSYDFSGAQRRGKAHGCYQDALLRGNIYMAASQAGTVLSNLSATATGMVLTNPLGSRRYAVLLSAGSFQTSAAGTAANVAVGLAVGLFSTTAVIHTTSMTVRNALDGGPAGVMLVDSAATLPAAPVAIQWFQAPSVSATATTFIPPVIYTDQSGLISIGPGMTLSFTNISGNPHTAAYHMFWEEVPI